LPTYTTAALGRNQANAWLLIEHDEISLPSKCGDVAFDFGPKRIKRISLGNFALRRLSCERQAISQLACLQNTEQLATILPISRIFCELFWLRS